MFCASVFGALKRGFRSMASLILVRNVVGELQPKRTLAASRGFLAAARLSCFLCCCPWLIKIHLFRQMMFPCFPVLLFPPLHIWSHAFQSSVFSPPFPLKDTTQSYLLFRNTLNFFSIVTDIVSALQVVRRCRAI